MASVRFVVASTTVGQYGSADFTITATGSLAVDTADASATALAYGISFAVGISGNNLDLTVTG